MTTSSLADRQTVAIEAAADALLAVCALQTGSDPDKTVARAHSAIAAVYRRAAAGHGVFVKTERYIPREELAEQAARLEGGHE